MKDERKSEQYFNEKCKTCQNYRHNGCLFYAPSTEELCEDNGYLDYLPKEELE